MTLAAEETEQRVVTFEQFLDMPDSADYELVEGRLVERKQMGVYANFVAAQITALLISYCREHKSGAVFNAETLYRCFGSPLTGRKPDVSFVRADRLSEQHVRAGFFTLVPDLVVEVTSPNDLVYNLEEKLAEYKRVGVPAVWVVHPNTRRVQVHRSDGTAVDLDEGGEIKGEPVLPGFACGVKDFFPPFPPA